MSDDLLRIETEGDADRLVVLVTGELDPSTSPLLAHELTEDAVGDRTVVLDLGGVDFVDSSGLRTLIGAATRLGPRLVLRSPSPVVERIFELAGITDQFVVEPA